MVTLEYKLGWSFQPVIFSRPVFLLVHTVEEYLFSTCKY